MSVPIQQNNRISTIGIYHHLGSIPIRDFMFQTINNTQTSGNQVKEPMQQPEQYKPQYQPRQTHATAEPPTIPGPRQILRLQRTDKVPNRVLQGAGVRRIRLISSTGQYQLATGVQLFAGPAYQYRMNQKHCRNRSPLPAAELWKYSYL